MSDYLIVGIFFFRRAIEWDASFKNRADCSGRSVAGVHIEAYDDKFQITAEEKAVSPSPEAVTGKTKSETKASASKRQKK